MRSTFRFLSLINIIAFTLAMVILPPISHAEGELSKCVDLFPGKAIGNAPRLLGALEGIPSGSNLHMCARSSETPFFAMEYDPKRYAPVWVGYRISDTFGPTGCKSMTRAQMQCHFSQDNIASCLKKRKGSDPFHPEAILSQLRQDRLGVSAFSGTGHDRGHMAPNNSFSWHTCAAYKTFTMANMVAQWGSLNRELWANLEAQVLFWGIKQGPVHVVTGPIWAPFPSEEFESIRSGTVAQKRFAKPNEVLKKRDGRPLTKNIPLPTGFYKVVYTTAKTNEPERAIAFLVPHTKQRGLSFWNFVASVDLVEKSTGIHFGFHPTLKGAADLKYWRAAERKVPPRWTPRKGCSMKGEAQGWMPEKSVSERIATCDLLDKQ